ncbi:MAG: hypothetical protein INR62_00450 [Rhodospirillales bacterium]|nr:hypothetical protein [Acetobacter sp.]
MNNQQKREVKDEKISAVFPVGEAVAAEGTAKSKRGRPKTSPHDSATQNRLRVQRYRDAKREGEEVPVEVYLPKAWHEWLTNVKAANLREVAVEAFALWLKKNGYPADVTAKPTSLNDA